MDFKDLEILISDNGFARVLDSPSNMTTEAVKLDIDPISIGENYSRTIKRANLPDSALRELGLTLYRGLFNKKIKTVFDHSVGVVHRPEEMGLRIKLRLESTSYANLPWELLYSQETGFLATNSRFSICRFLKVERPSIPIKVSLPLSILIAVARPNKLHWIDFDAEKVVIEQALEKYPDRGLIKPVFINSMTRPSLLSYLQENKVHILHFIGHGDWVNDEGVIYLEHPNGDKDEMTAQDLADMLSNFSSLRLVVLNACKTSMETSEGVFRGVASQLCNHSIPATVAMRNPIEDDVAIRFSKHFYGNLVGGEKIEVAITHTRQQLINTRGVNPWAFCLPTLHMHTPDGSLFEIIDTRKKIVAITIQKSTQLSEALGALAEWKNLHDILQHILQDLNTLHRLAINTEANIDLKPIWNSGASTKIHGRLIPFARVQIRYVGQAFKDTPQGPIGEEWATKLFDLSNKIDKALGNRNRSHLTELIKRGRRIIIKHTRLCNQKMVELMESTRQYYEGVRKIFEELKIQDEELQSPSLDWPAINRELVAIGEYRERIKEWISLHDIFDTLQSSFTLVSPEPEGDQLAQITKNWEWLRDTIISDLLFRAGQISRIGRAYIEHPDGSLEGVRSVLEIKKKSNELDNSVEAKNLELTKKRIEDTQDLIDTLFLEIDTNTKGELENIKNHSIALHNRILK